MILLDTHTLVWFAYSPEKLSAAAAKAISASEKENGGIKILSLSFWEIALKEKSRVLKNKLRGRIREAEYLPDGTASELLDRCLSFQGIEIIDSSASAWIASAKLEWAHRDPVDRLLVIMAKKYNSALVTKDAEIREYYPGCIW